MALRPINLFQASGLRRFFGQGRIQSKHWKQETKVDVEKIERVEKERDEAKQDAKVTRLETVAASKDKTRVEDDLTRVQDALAAAEEDRHGLEAEVARLTVERTSLLLELEASREKVFVLHSQVGKDKEAMVEDYQKSLKQIFAYGYR